MKLLTRIARLSAPALLAMALAFPAAAQNYCNNPVPPCDPNNPASACYKPPDPPPKCEPKICDKCTKSPCYVGSGVYSFDAQDLKIATAGFPIEVTRLYQSTHAIDGESGYGWTSSLSSRLYYTVFLKAAPSTYQKEADVRLPNGTVYRFVENGDGSFTPPEGRFDVLVHNPDGTWDFWIQRTRSRYNFSATGNLLAMVDDFGNTQTWTYVDDRVSHIEDTSGSARSIDVTYGGDGRISDVTDMTGRNVHYVYNGSGVMTSVTNPAAQTTTYGYISGKYVPLLNLVKDHWNRILTSVNYDAQDRVRSYTDKDELFTYTYAYNGVATTTAKADSSGNTWIYPFGVGGVVVDSIPPGGGAAAHDDYYSNGLVQLHIDPVGVKTYYTYNAQGNPLSIIRDYQGATAVEFRYVYDTTFPEQVVSIKAYTPGTNTIHPHWQAQKFDYYGTGTTAPGALYHVYEVDDDGVTSRVTHTFTYDSHGRVLSDTTASGAVTSFQYDTAGNRTRVEYPANNDAGTRPAITLTYDSLGRRLTSTDALSRTTSYTWDVLDRLLTITEQPPAGSPVTFVTTNYYDEYDSVAGTLTKRSVDPYGRTTRIASDAWGQVVSKTDTLGQKVRYTFTKGLLTSKTDENNYITTYAYDALRRLQIVSYPDGTFEKFTYLADSNIASYRDRAAQTVSFTYDRHKRAAVHTYPGGATVTYSYAGQKLLSVVDTLASPADTTTLTWDASFRIASEAEGTRGTLSYTYTNEGRVATEALSGGPTTTYGYYPDGSVRTLTWSPVAGVFQFNYSLAGEKSSLTFPNGQTRAYTYDALGRVTAVANVHPTAGNLASFAYGYDVDAFTGLPDKAGLRTSVVTDFPALSLTAASTKYGYDARGRLVRADYPSGTSSLWAYDASGNRTSATTNGTPANYSYLTFPFNALNAAEMLSDGSNTYTYDANGNNVSRSGPGGSFTFGYDVNNRMVSIGGAASASYKYDVINRRTSKTVSGVTTTYVYSDLNVISESGADTARFLHAPGFDSPLAMERGGAVYYYDVDALGSVVAVNDDAGTVRNSYAWDAWGVAISRNETIANPFGYTAREFGEAGLTYYRDRYYDAATGSFRSVDPVVPWTGFALARGLAGPFNQMAEYSYVDGNPAMFTDPMGLGSCDLCGQQYNNKVSDCAYDHRIGSGLCFSAIVLCLKYGREPRACGLTFIACAVAVELRYTRCLNNAARDYKLCMQHCDMCPVPPPPPPQMSPPPPSPPSPPNDDGRHYF